ncbi:MAG TPA: hypothetical protein VKU89_11650 [Solirubrobacteraceae bacterium]|nr:hypothetical protein [Solirubrobacteraceae bacterium]
MIYQVVPKEAGEQLYRQLVEHYRDDPNVTVIVDRRSGDRRRQRSGESVAAQSDGRAEEQRQIRDRRRRRVVGELSRVQTYSG